MADSDNTTTLPLVTRRSILAGIAFVGLQRKASAGNASEKDFSADPAVAVWRKWQAAHEQVERLCREQQRLERKLAETVGFPCATIRLRDGERVTLRSIQAVRNVLSFDPEDMAMRAKAEAEIAAHQGRWDAAAREIGYSAALRAEYEAGDRAEDLLQALAETPASSLAGVAAKLDAVMREGEICEESDEFPWPQIRSALEDIGRIGWQTEPSQVFPNRMRQLKPVRTRGEGCFRVDDGANGDTV
ncbi:hypothetical protein [Mesorhizobium sp.]|uniref:hypothetical protein n=1 Tax=Mesorhizobium sp. TaxID=1871066 RepID=UPI0025B9DF6E|nr:hypothetical protein [Mesorhizobium sp.]